MKDDEGTLPDGMHEMQIHEEGWFSFNPFHTCSPVAVAQAAIVLRDADVPSRAKRRRLPRQHAFERARLVI